MTNISACKVSATAFNDVYSSDYAGILNRQSRAERQNTFDWLHILPVRVTISQYKSYSAKGSHILSILVIFYRPE